MTDVNPSATASSTSDSVTAWSRCSTQGTVARSATALVARAIGASAPW